MRMIRAILILSFCFASFANTFGADKPAKAADSVSNNYRMYNNQQFKIIDTSLIWIYQYQTKIIDMVKVSSKSTKAVNKTVTEYYFSYDGHSELFQLTISNIKLLFFNHRKQYAQFCESFKTTESMLVKASDGSTAINKFLSTKSDSE